MIVVDTSIWVDMFRGRDTALDLLLDRGEALIHPLVIGELQLGGLPPRGVAALQQGRTRIAPVAEPEEVSRFIEDEKLAGMGIGYVDTHLLVSARLATGLLLTSDTKLRRQAERLGVAYF